MHQIHRKAPVGDGDSEHVFVYIPEAEVCSDEQDEDLDLLSPPLSLLSGSLCTFTKGISLHCITPLRKGTLLHNREITDVRGGVFCDGISSSGGQNCAPAENYYLLLL